LRWCRYRWRWWNRVASCQWISCISRLTSTNGTVLDDLAIGVKTTSSGTRITTFLIYACLIESTFRTDNTFRSTTWWTSDIIGQARANGLAVGFTTLTVGATRGRLTRVGRSIFLNGCKTRSELLIEQFLIQSYVLVVVNCNI
jgi:hypothetical protein